MSIFRDHEVVCPKCGRKETRELCVSLNAPRRPDVVKQIVDDAFQRFDCAGCGTRFLVDGPLLYLDFEKRVWIAAFPRAWRPRWRELERDPSESFRQALGEEAAPPARALAEGFRVRATFGLDGLRDKLRCFAAGLDDAALEALKLELLGGSSAVPLAPGVRLELVRAGESELHLAVRGRSAGGELSVARARLETIAADAEWAGIKKIVAAGPYVSAERVTG